MKKVYRNKLPKGAKVLGFNAYTDNGDIVVKIELEDKFKPKFGDIVVVKSEKSKFSRNYMICIYPDTKDPFEKYKRSFFNIANIDYSGELSFDCGNGCDVDDKLEISPANDSQKKELLDELEKNGKRWNAETKQLEDIFKPKDGDFLYSKYSGVFIYNNKHTAERYGSYCGINDWNELVTSEPLSIWTDKKDCRYATPEEKTAFLERLEKEKNLRWNEKTKKLEPIRWRAEVDKTYFVVSNDDNSFFVKEKKESSSIYDEINYKMGNYFRTQEAAQKAADKIIEAFANHE